MAFTFYYSALFFIYSCILNRGQFINHEIIYLLKITDWASSIIEYSISCRFFGALIIFTAAIKLRVKLVFINRVKANMIVRNDLLDARGYVRIAVYKQSIVEITFELLGQHFSGQYNNRYTYKYPQLVVWPQMNEGIRCICFC